MRTKTASDLQKFKDKVLERQDDYEIKTRRIFSPQIIIHHVPKDFTEENIKNYFVHNYNLEPNYIEVKLHPG